MQLAMDQNFNYGDVFPQFQQVLSFQTEPENRSSSVTTTTGSFASFSSSVGIMNSSCSMASPSNSHSSPVDAGHNLKYNTAMSVDWSNQELDVLKDGLEKYANEPSIMKYIKIAADLPDKTVRDVALRCQWNQWMMKKDNAKRRKHNVNFCGKRMRETKLPDSSAWTTSSHTQSDAEPSPSYMMRNVNKANQYLYGAPELDNAIRCSLEENARLLNQIATNIVACQSQNNFDLFTRTRSNITAILDSSSMIQLPGIVRKMPPLPVSVNDRLAGFVLTTLPGSTTEQINLQNYGAPGQCSLSLRFYGSAST